MPEPEPTETTPPPRNTRERLLRAAIELMAEQGWGAVTTRMVAERAGVNQALVHYHYRSVPGLLREAAYAAMSVVFEPATLRLLGAEDPLVALQGVLEAVVDIDRDAPESRAVIEATVQAVRDPELNAQMREMLALFRRLLAERVAAAQADGQVGAGVQPEGMAVVLAALADGLALHRLVDPGTDIAAATSVVLALLKERR